MINDNNNLVSRAFTSVSKELAGLNRRDGKRPDGLTLIPRRGGKPVCWDVTVVSTCTYQLRPPEVVMQTSLPPRRKPRIQTFLSSSQ